LIPSLPFVTNKRRESRFILRHRPLCAFLHP
jgi:hypothetical protein